MEHITPLQVKPKSERYTATMKFFEQLKEPERSEAIKNYNEGRSKTIPLNLHGALDSGFEWDKSKQGPSYWDNLYNSIRDNTYFKEPETLVKSNDYNEAVHCTTQEEWDFVLSKFNPKGVVKDEWSGYRDDIYIITASSNSEYVGCYSSKNYIINNNYLTFKQWCDKYNHCYVTASLEGRYIKCLKENGWNNGKTKVGQVLEIKKINIEGDLFIGDICLDNSRLENGQFELLPIDYAPIQITDSADKPSREELIRQALLIYKPGVKFIDVYHGAEWVVKSSEFDNFGNPDQLYVKVEPNAKFSNKTARIYKDGVWATLTSDMMKDDKEDSPLREGDWIYTLPDSHGYGMHPDDINKIFKIKELLSYGANNEPRLRLDSLSTHAPHDRGTNPVVRVRDVRRATKEEVTQNTQRMNTIAEDQVVPFGDEKLPATNVKDPTLFSDDDYMEALRAGTMRISDLTTWRGVGTPSKDLLSLDVENIYEDEIKLLL